MRGFGVVVSGTRMQIMAWRLSVPYRAARPRLTSSFWCQTQDDYEVADIFLAVNFARRKPARADLDALAQSPVLAKLRKVRCKFAAYITHKNADGAQVALVTPVTMPLQSNHSQLSDLLHMYVA